MLIVNEILWLPFSRFILNLLPSLSSRVEVLYFVEYAMPYERNASFGTLPSTSISTNTGKSVFSDWR